MPHVNRKSMLSSTASRMIHRQHGFTLLELLIASIIFAIMAVMAYGGLNNVIKNSESSQQALQRLQQVQQCVAVLDRDFSQIVPRSIRNEFGVTLPYLVAGNDIDQLIEFTRGGRVNPANLKRSSMLRVAYRAEKENLVRIQWQQLDRAQGIEPKTTTLLEGVDEANIRFLDAEGEWHERWPPLSASSTGSLRPLAIEIVLQLKDWGDIRRLYSMI